MKKLFIVTLSFLVLSFSGNTFAGQDFSEKIVGTYLITENSGNQRIWTFFQDGNFLSTSSVQPRFGFNDQQGSWKKTGKNEIQGVLLNFGFKKDNSLDYTGRLTATIKFNKDGKTLEGQYSLRKYESPEDPMKPKTDAAKPILSTFKGQRLSH
ncbi:conserved hypothetical protein, secreted [Candidatus Magnetomorum sp. HK-1]|nr:conserved hypothetical protein, secreted [Candidatus Magnetomorum sp. HK-1]